MVGVALIEAGVVKEAVGELEREFESDLTSKGELVESQVKVTSSIHKV